LGFGLQASGFGLERLDELVHAAHELPVSTAEPLMIRNHQEAETLCEPQ